MRKKLSALFAIVSLFVFLGAACSFNAPSKANTASVNQVATNEKVVSQTAEVKIVYGKPDKQNKTYDLAVSSDATAFSMLQKAAKENGFTVDYSNSSFGVFITGIDGVANEKDRFWLYYMGETSPEVAADKQAVKAGEKVEFRFEEAR